MTDQPSDPNAPNPPTGWGSAPGQPTDPAADQPAYPQQPYGQQPQYAPPPPGYAQPAYQAAPQYAPPYAAPPERKGLSITAMVLGIVSLVLAFIPFGSYVAVVTALLAIVFGIMGIRRGAGRGMAISGLVLGIVGLLAAVLMSIIYTIGFRIISECADEVGTTSGPAFEQCVKDKANNVG